MCKNHVRGTPYSRLCSVPDCFRPGQHLGSYFTGTEHPRRRKTCDKHHFMEHGLNGWEYKIYRKDYCENIDGRLGFVCTTNITHPELQLDADHWDGNPYNNNLDNIVTLCKCCHAVKTNMYKDYLTPGRKNSAGKHGALR